MTSFASEIERYLSWMTVHNYAATTVENRRRYLGYFRCFAADLGIERSSDVTYELVVSYQEGLHAYRKADGEPLSIATQVQRLIPITQFFTWLRRQQKIGQNPTADLLMPRPDRQLPEATLSQSEMSRLMCAPDVTKPLGLRDRALLEVFYSSALRRSELIGLRVRDVDFERGTLFVHRGKGAKDRHVPIGERALFWVRLYLGMVRPLFDTAESSDTLFISSVGTPICADWLCRKVRSYLGRANINKRGSCHLLRHSVATLMLEGGADIRYVAEMLGHARLETTQRYTRVSIDRLRAVHASCHPAAGLNVALASELCALLPEATDGLKLG
ncbi:MAG TPA: tyrosine-type recombinase/integrase [Acidimicrobiales bacterium]|jgi:integrase/recombinase XerD|nr:tyrosine-type recombinase/integrase [Acidimicrobiales bacterium]